MKLQSESFQWAQSLLPVLKQFENDGVSYYKVVASNADIKNRNGRIYTTKELQAAASSLSERPLNINHDKNSQLPFPENEVVAARFEDGRVECIIQVADDKTKKMLDDGEIQKVSIEGLYLDESKNTTDTEYPTSLHFRGLALLTGDDEPGDPLTQIIKESLAGRTIIERIFLPSTDAVWTTAFINDLPDSAFAFIEPGGRKDEEGKTVPRSLRHFPYKGADGEVDLPHLRNALARLSTSALTASQKDEAEKVLVAAAKKAGIRTSLGEGIVVTKASETRGLGTEEGTELVTEDKNLSSLTEEQQQTKPESQKTVSDAATTTTAQATNTSVPQNIQATQTTAQPVQVTVKVDASEIKEAVSNLATTLSSAKNSDSPPRPRAIVSTTEAQGQPKDVEESKEVKERKRFERIWTLLKGVKEDISSSGASAALGQEWLPDAIALPSDLPANLRQFCQVQIIPKGAKTANWTTITTPAFSSLTEDSSPTDVSQTVAGISATPTETGAKQRVSYITIESSTPDLVAAVERTFLRASLIDEDANILSACDSATPAATLYGDESVTAESSITSSMTFAAKRLASAVREIMKKGYVVQPGDAVAVLHPVQYDALLKDANVTQYLYFGSTGPIQAGQIPQVYGVNVVRSTKVPTGSGSGSPAITTYHGQVWLKPSYQGADGIGAGGTVGLAISRDLLVETWRNIYERALYIVASHRIATAVLQANSLVHIYTA